MKAILMCLLSLTSVLSMGTKYHVSPDKLYGKGDEFEKRVKDHLSSTRA